MVDNTATTWTEDGLVAFTEASPFRGATKHWQDKAMSFFIDDGFPNRQDEAWRYTDLSSLLAHDFVLPSTTTKISLQSLEFMDCHQLVIVDGIVDLSLSRLDDDVSIYPLDQLLASADETLLRELRIDLQKPYFACLNSAMMMQGCYVKVQRNQKLAKPLRILHVATEEKKSYLKNIRIFIDIDSNAEATIFEEYTTLAENCYFNNIVTQINMGFNAHLNYYKLQQEAKTAFHIAMTIVALSADSNFDYHVFSNGGLLSRDDLYVRHYERGATAQLTGFYRALGSQHVSHHTRIDHLKGGASTHQHYKGLVRDQAHAAFDGKIVVHPGAAKSTAHQSNHNLLIGEGGEVDTKPNLEIYTDDVVASHGATIGQLDEKALFYLQSRGITKPVAHQMLVAGFVEAVFDDIKNNPIKDYIKSVLLQEVMDGV